MVRTAAEDIADFLISRGLATAKGTDVFQAIVPDEPSNSILIIEGAGTAAERTHDPRRVLNVGITIIVRRESSGFNAGYDLVRRIYDAMLDFVNTSVEGHPYLGANPLGDTNFLGRDERDRWKWSMNFIVKTV